MNTRWLYMALFAMIMGLLLASCSPEREDSSHREEEPEEVEVEQYFEPVTLQLYNSRIEITEYWDELIANPLKSTYPHIDVVELTGNMNNLVASGTTIDIYVRPHVETGTLVQLDLGGDIEPLMKAHGMDINRFDPAAIEAIRNNSGTGQLLGLPFYQQFFVIYYNKDIFDLFGVPYPSDGLTWDETVDVARRVTRSHENVNYLGFKPDQIHRLADPFGVTPVDAATNKASVINDSYRRAFELSQRFFSIPGNMPAAPRDVNRNALNQFTQDKNLAMYYAVNRFANLRDSGVNWDMAQSPYYPENPNVGGIVDSFIIGVSKTSKHQDDAFRVIDSFLSRDVQLFTARSLGIVSPLVDPIYQEQYAAEIDYLQDKNLSAIFKNKIIPHDPYSIYRSQSMNILYEVHGEFIFGMHDLNTALRVADERINQMVQSMMSQ